MTEQAVRTLQQLHVSQRLLDAEIRETSLAERLTERDEKWGVEVQTVNEHARRPPCEQGDSLAREVARPEGMLQRGVLEGLEHAVQLAARREELGQGEHGLEQQAVACAHGEVDHRKTGRGAIVAAEGLAMRRPGAGKTTGETRVTVVREYVRGGDHCLEGDGVAEEPRPVGQRSEPLSDRPQQLRGRTCVDRLAGGVACPTPLSPLADDVPVAPIVIAL